MLQEVCIAMGRAAWIHQRVMEQCACTQLRKAVSAHLDQWQKGADVIFTVLPRVHISQFPIFAVYLIQTQVHLSYTLIASVAAIKVLD